MKERLDVLLVSGGYAQSREKAKAIIMSGNVFVNGQREDKAGTTFDPAKVKIEVKLVLKDKMIAGEIISTDVLLCESNGTYQLQGKYACLEMIGQTRKEEIYG